jgi:glycosyltransferase involved in cell wall biosynthesis
LDLPKEQTIILAVGSLAYRKGFDRIVLNFPKILKNYPDAALYIIGAAGHEGDYRSELDELIVRYSLKNKVKFVGQIENQDLPLWYNAADVFCLSSRGEGSPNVLTEALACGCPSVATKVGAVPDILEKGFMGIVVQNDEKSLLSGLLYALSIRYDRKKIAETIRQYTWDWCAAKVVEVYKKMGHEHNENSLSS